jgi:hypothetical protein
MYFRIFKVQSYQENANSNFIYTLPIPVRKAIKKKITHNKKYLYGRGIDEVRTHCWFECKLVNALWKSVWSFLKNLKIIVLYETAILFLGIY